MRPVHLLGLLAMNVLWAGSYSAFKGLSVRLTAGEIVTWRFVLAAAVLALAWRWLPGRGPRGFDLVRAALMGVVVFVVGPRLQVLGVQLGRAGDSAVVVALEPLVTAVAAALFLREHVPVNRWAGFALGMVGIVLLNGGWQLQLSGPGMWANLIFVSSFVCESAYSVMGKPLLRRSSPIKLVAVALFLGSALNVLIDGPGALAKGSLLTMADWLNLAYLSWVCTLIGYTFWLVVVREADVSLAALTILVQPVFGIAIAAATLGEEMHWGQLWGTLVILGGVILGLERSSFAPRVDETSATARGLPRQDVSTSEWETRVATAERRADAAERVVKAGLLPYLASLLGDKLTATLLRQRRNLIAGQIIGTQKAEVLERRLAGVEAEVRRKLAETGAQAPAVVGHDTGAPAAATAPAIRRNPLVQRRTVESEPVAFNELLARRRQERGMDAPTGTVPRTRKEDESGGHQHP
jgi:drug/metabolite transporter (DMT)-like permease